MKRGVAWAALTCALFFSIPAAAEKPGSQRSPETPATEKTRDGAKNDAARALESRLNARLRDEVSRNQCAFRKNADVLEPGCHAKLNKLAAVLVDTTRTLVDAGLHGHRFEVSGHTESSDDAARDKALSERRAAAIARELSARGVPPAQFVTVGAGSERRLVIPDDTPAKKAKNRRYEITLRR